MRRNPLVYISVFCAMTTDTVLSFLVLIELYRQRIISRSYLTGDGDTGIIILAVAIPHLFSFVLVFSAMSLTTKARILTNGFTTGLFFALSLLFAIALRSQTAPLSFLHVVLLLGIMVLGLLYSIAGVVLLLVLTIYRGSALSDILTGEKTKFKKFAENTLRKSGCEKTISRLKDDTAQGSACSICLEEYQACHKVF